MGVSCIFMVMEFMLGNKIGNDCMNIAFNGYFIHIDCKLDPFRDIYT